MKRRRFLRTSVGLAAGFSLSRIVIKPLTETPAFASNRKSYQPGETIDAEVFVYDRDREKQILIDLCTESSENAVVMLYIFGGGAMATLGVLAAFGVGTHSKTFTPFDF